MKHGGGQIYTRDEISELKYENDEIVGGTLSVGNNCTYKGGLKQKKHGLQKEGHGIITCEDGTLKAGTFKDNELIYAKIKTPNGDVYEGEIWNNQKHGKGTMIGEKSGRVVKGKWENDELIYANEMKEGNMMYVGEVQNDVKNGKGKFTVINPPGLLEY